jgi:hypothetical protein
MVFLIIISIIFVLIVSFFVYYRQSEQKDIESIITGENIWHIDGIEAVSQYNTFRFEYKGNDWLNKIESNNDVFNFFKRGGDEVDKENNRKLNELAKERFKKEGLYKPEEPISNKEKLTNKQFLIDKIEEAYRRR